MPHHRRWRTPRKIRHPCCISLHCTPHTKPALCLAAARRCTRCMCHQSQHAQTGTAHTPQAHPDRSAARHLSTACMSRRCLPCPSHRSRSCSSLRSACALVGTSYMSRQSRHAPRRTNRMSSGLRVPACLPSMDCTHQHVLRFRQHRSGMPCAQCSAPSHPHTARTRRPTPPA
eukprot:SAG11_NODE_8208_length_1046_cov_3.894403_1_plen_173_part_00